MSPFRLHCFLQSSLVESANGRSCRESCTGDEETHILELVALTSRMTLALAVGSLRPVSLRGEDGLLLCLAASSTSSAAAGAAAAGADAAGMAISVMLRRVLSALTRSDASSNVSFSIWSTMPEILASTGAALRSVEVELRLRIEGRRRVARPAEGSSKTKLPHCQAFLKQKGDDGWWKANLQHHTNQDVFLSTQACSPRSTSRRTGPERERDTPSQRRSLSQPKRPIFSNRLPLSFAPDFASSSQKALKNRRALGHTPPLPISFSHDKTNAAPSSARFSQALSPIDTLQAKIEGGDAELAFVLSHCASDLIKHFTHRGAAARPRLAHGGRGKSEHKNEHTRLRHWALGTRPGRERAQAATPARGAAAAASAT